MKDLLGRELSVGDCVAVTTRGWGQNFMRVGTVAELRPYTYSWNKYDPKTRKYTSISEEKTEIVVDIFMGSGRSFKRSTWDGNKHTYYAAKGFRRAYRNEEHVVLIREAMTGVSLLEDLAAQKKQAWADMMNAIPDSANK